jgi:type IV pilus assembly protein PilP
MKRLHLQKRVGKSELGDLRSLSPWGLSVALLVSLLLSVQVGSIHSQERPGTRRAQPNTPAPPIPKPQESADDYRYSAQDRRDPLEPLLKETPPDVLRPKPRQPERPLGPLERFDLSALKLVGIVWGELGRKALIKAPDGKSYFATLETYMGKYSGKVIAIENDRLVIEEQYLNSEDKLVPKTLTLPLRHKDKKEG